MPARKASPLRSPQPTLLVIGIHREELAFGQAVAAGLADAPIDVLTIPEGLPGRHPRPDERFRHDTLHRELYLQLLPHARGRRLLIDLHSGIDPQGRGADIYCRVPERLAPLAARPAGDPPPRLVRLGAAGAGRFPDGSTIIPAEVWQNPHCLYVGMEIYLPAPGTGSAADRAYASALVRTLATAAALTHAVVA